MRPDRPGPARAPVQIGSGPPAGDGDAVLGDGPWCRQHRQQIPSAKCAAHITDSGVGRGELRLDLDIDPLAQGDRLHAKRQVEVDTELVPLNTGFR